MKYFINESHGDIIEFDPEFQTIVKYTQFTEIEEEVEEEEVEEEEQKPKKPAKGIKVMVVTKDNWPDFDPKKPEGMSEEENKEYKKQYAKYWYYKKNHNQKESNKIKDEIKESRKEMEREEKTRDRRDEILIQQPTATIPQEKKQIPFSLLNKYDSLVIDVIIAEKNDGIGKDPDEIFEGRDKRIRHLAEWQIVEIWEELDRAGL